jgi:DNA polymerase-3 subunit delta'
MAETDDDGPECPPPPRKNPELIGHGAAEAVLLDAWNSGRMAHAWMLCGHKGIGKATLAYRFARFALAGGGAGGLFGDGMFGDGPDGLAMDAEDPVFRRVAAGGHADMMAVTVSYDDKRKRWREEIVVDDVRALGLFMRLTASEGGWRVAVVDCADDMNVNAANALLKILEEPPDKALLLLVSHTPNRLLPTIRSRVRRLPMQPLDEAQVTEFLGRYRPELDAGEVSALARLAEGSPGRALRLADAGGLALYGEMVEMLSAVDGLDVAALHALGDRMARANARDAFATLMELLSQWLVAMVRAGAAGAPPNEVVAGEGAVAERLLARASLEQWTEVWEKIGRLAADVERINLDRKQVVISAFNALEATARN